MLNARILLAASLVALGAAGLDAADLFRVTANGGSAVDYATFEAAATAANAIPNTQTAKIALLGNATYDTSVSFMRSVALTSEGGPWTLTRAAASACIYVGTNIVDGAIGTYTSTASKGVTVKSDCNYYDLTVSDLTIDGGAVWASDDVTDMTNTGVGPGCLFYVHSWLNNSFQFVAGRVILSSGATVQNAEAQDYSAARQPCGVFCFWDGTHERGGGNGKLRIDAGGKLTRCRGAKMSVCWTETRFYPGGGFNKGEVQLGEGPVHVAGGEISFCAMNNPSAPANYGGVVGGGGGGFSMASGFVHDNYSANCGGVVSAKGIVLISGGVFTRNRAACGGVFYHGSGWFVTSTIAGGVFSNNTARVRGGAVCCNDTSQNPQLYLKGTPYIAGNWVDDGTNPRYENNLQEAASSVTKLSIYGALPDGAHVGITVPSAAVGTQFAILQAAHTSLTAHDVQGFFCDTDATLAGEVSGGNIVWKERGYASVATVTTGAGSVGCPSLKEAIEVANAAGAPVTVTLADDVTMSGNYEISGDVTLVAAKALTVDGGTLIAADGGRLALSGAGLTLDMAPVVRGGGRLDFLAGNTATVTGAITLQAGGVLGLAGQPSLTGDITPVAGDQIVLLGALRSDVTVAYPNSATYYDVPFALVADGYTATEDDAERFKFKFTSDVAGVVAGQKLQWPPKEVATDDFAVTVDGETTRYTSLGDALKAANAVDASKAVNIAILKNTTFDERVSIMRGMTIASGPGGPFALKRKSAYGRIYIGTNVWDGSIVQPASASKAARVVGDRTYYDAVFTNIVVDGGARWASDDVTDMTNTGIGPSCLFYVFGKMQPNYTFGVGSLILDDGAVVRNVEASDVAPRGAIDLEAVSNGTSQMTVRKGALVTRLRGANTSPIYSSGNRVWPHAQSGCPLLVNGGEISFCAMNGASVALMGGVYGGASTGFGVISGLIHDNHSANHAGVFTCSYDSRAYVTGGTFYNNSAKYGGVFFHGSGVWMGYYIGGGVFSNNTASVAGGAICLEWTSAPDQLTFSGGKPVIVDNWVGTGDGRRRSNIEAAAGVELAKVRVAAMPEAGAKIGLTTAYAPAAEGVPFLTVSGCAATPAGARRFFADIPPAGTCYRGAVGEGAAADKIVWGLKPGAAILLR